MDLLSESQDIYNERVIPPTVGSFDVSKNLKWRTLHNTTDVRSRYYIL